MAKDVGTRRLIWTTLIYRAGYDDEKVREGSERCDAYEDRCDGPVDLPKIARKRATEEQECRLQHQWQQLHHVVEVPRYDPIQLPLPVLAALNHRPS